jgi:phosphoesterase RecJ-like protein
MTFSHAELSSLSDISETEEFVNYARSLNTARIAMGFKEVSPGEIRVSFRSKGPVDVAEIASRHGGGGHRNAAGCTIRGDLKDVVKRLVAEAGRFLNELEAALP